MLWELIGTIGLKLVGLFISKAEERKAWEKAIKARLAELDSTATESAQLHSEYEKLQARLRKPNDDLANDSKRDN